MRTHQSEGIKLCGGNKKRLYLLIVLLFAAVLIICGTVLIFLPNTTQTTQAPMTEINTSTTQPITEQTGTTPTPTTETKENPTRTHNTISTTQTPITEDYTTKTLTTVNYTSTTQPITEQTGTTPTPTTETTGNPTTIHTLNTPTTSHTPIPTQTPSTTHTTNTTQSLTTVNYTYEYVAIVDAGSTGSRIIVYRFDSRKETRNELRLLASDFSYENKTILSSYLNKPDEGVRFIEKLLEKAREFIPWRMLAYTRLALRTTSALRTEDKDKVDYLMEKLRDLFANSGFKVNKNSVEIMEDTDKEIYTWITVNYLKDSLSSSQTMQYASMKFTKLGIQTTYSKVNAEAPTDKLENIHKLSVAEKNIDVAIRLEHRKSFNESYHAILINGNNTQEHILYSVCVNPQVSNATWTYQNVEYLISGKHNGKDIVDFEACAKLIKEKVIPDSKPKPEILKQLAVWNNFFFLETNISTVGAVHEEAKKECKILHGNRPFRCLKMIYIWTLLSDGIGLPEEYTLQNPPPIYGHNVSWTLGCALNLLNYVKFLN